MRRLVAAALAVLLAFALACGGGPPTVEEFERDGGVDLPDTAQDVEFRLLHGLDTLAQARFRMPEVEVDAWAVSQGFALAPAEGGTFGANGEHWWDRTLPDGARFEEAEVEEGAAVRSLKVHPPEGEWVWVYYEYRELW